jgi:hypothetical protein
MPLQESSSERKSFLTFFFGENHNFTSLEQMQRSQLKTNYPDHWHEINESDQKKYRKLQSRIALVKTRTHQGQGTLKFQWIMKEINDFAICNDDDDWKRCFVCGIIWLNDAIAVNTQQIHSLTG